MTSSVTINFIVSCVLKVFKVAWVAKLKSTDHRKIRFAQFCYLLQSFPFMIRFYLDQTLYLDAINKKCVICYFLRFIIIFQYIQYDTFVLHRIKLFSSKRIPVRINNQYWIRLNQFMYLRSNEIFS